MGKFTTVKISKEEAEEAMSLTGVENKTAAVWPSNAAGQNSYEGESN